MDQHDRLAGAVVLVIELNRCGVLASNGHVGHRVLLRSVIASDSCHAILCETKGPPIRRLALGEPDARARGRRWVGLSRSSKRGWSSSIDLSFYRAQRGGIPHLPLRFWMCRGVCLRCPDASQCVVAPHTTPPLLDWPCGVRSRGHPLWLTG